MKTATKAKIILVSGLSILEILVGIFPSLGTKPGVYRKFAQETYKNSTVVERTRPGLSELVNEIFFPESALAGEQGQVEYKNTIRDQLNENDYSGAILTCDSALKSYSNDADFLYYKGFALFKKGDFKNAMDAYKTAGKINPFKINQIIDFKNSNAQDNYLLGLNNIPNPDLAIKYFIESYKLEPDNPMGLSEAGKSYLDEKDYENAIKCFEQATILKPDFALIPLSRSYFLAKDYKRALFLSKLTLELLPDYKDRSIVEERIQICEKYLDL